MSEGDAVKALAGVRIVIGVSSWLTPRVAGRLFGLDAKANPQSPYLARLFGVRDIALGLGVLASEGDARRRMLVAGMACDGADALAGVAGGARGYLPKFTSLLVTGVALSAVGLGAAALSGEQD